MLTVEQILALAPDASAAKAGQGLAAPQKWVSLAHDEQAAWGECAGSAATPYQTQIDLQGPAFKCSCPSRKFPCKHSLGLFLLLATKQSAFQQGEQPAWVSSWLASRTRREEKKAEVATEKAPAEADPQAQAKRAAQREKKVSQGMEELERWLCDLARQGFGFAQTQPRSFWEGVAARMVDAQASGIARLVRQLRDIPNSGDGWEGRLLEKLGRLALLVDRYKKIESLPTSAQDDLRALIGWTQNQSELLAGEGIADRWVVLGQRVEREERLRVQRNWLWGSTTGRAALLLQYAPGKDGFATLVAPGTALDGELVYYPGSYPLRALIKTQQPPVSQLPACRGYAQLMEALKAYVAALSKYPWLEQFPLPLEGVTPLISEGSWLLRDASGQQIPIAVQFPYGWELHAFSGGQAVSVFGEWDGDTLLPLSVWNGERFVMFSLVEE